MKEAGKGDTYRPVNKKKYDRNYDRVFTKQDTSIMAHWFYLAGSLCFAVGTIINIVRQWK